VEGLSKADLKKPDVFVSSVSKTWMGIEKYRMLFFTLAVLLLAGGAGFSVYSWKLNKNEAEAQGQYFLAKKTLEEIQKTFEVDKEAVMAAEKKNEKPPMPKQKSGNLEQDFGPAVQKLEGVVQSHPKTKAAVMAGLELSALFQDYKQADRALAVMENLEKTTAPKEIVHGFVLLHKGNALQMKGDCQAAINSWDKIVAEKSLQLLHGEALLREGLCQEKLGDKNKSQEIYKRLSQDFADTEAGKAAKRYLRLTQQAG
jgi:predicted negative regulator of RcsB-dependent stress response